MENVTLEHNYQPCSICGSYVDDGGLKNDKFTCHDCLDEIYFDDLYRMQLRYFKGVYSHDTAMMLHELTTFSPFVYHLTFPKGFSLSNAKEQYIESHYVDEDELANEYVVVIDSWESNPIRVTNLEKTIVDSFRYEKFMTFIIQEMINNYLGRKDKNIDRLVKYAERFNVIDVVKREVLLRL